MGDPHKGAGIIVCLATDPAFAHTSGGYFSVRGARPLECPEPGRGEGVQRELWSRATALLDEHRTP
ncbi:hypothetical protein [Kitasatospora sp. NPDC005856]|uniref:hypothetical protein n=1 Tax=Kitasatospora sp. NPDC005856 TaxID=3154566 RepID=UPI0033D29B7C